MHLIAGLLALATAAGAGDWLWSTEPTAAEREALRARIEPDSRRLLDADAAWYAEVVRGDAMKALWPQAQPFYGIVPEPGASIDPGSFAIAIGRVEVVPDSIAVRRVGMPTASGPVRLDRWAVYVHYAYEARFSWTERGADGALRRRHSATAGMESHHKIFPAASVRALADRFAPATAAPPAGMVAFDVELYPPP